MKVCMLIIPQKSKLRKDTEERKSVICLLRAFIIKIYNNLIN